LRSGGVCDTHSVSTLRGANVRFVSDRRVRIITLSSSARSRGVLRGERRSWPLRKSRRNCENVPTVPGRTSVARLYSSRMSFWTGVAVSNMR
jgi:hypothetical protein